MTGKLQTSELENYQSFSGSGAVRLLNEATSTQAGMAI